MNRPIKFRGKKLNGEWVFGYGAMYNGGKAFILAEINTEVDPETVGQFTGLVDKNGVEIFEGDIVKYFVYFDSGQTGYDKAFTKTVTYKDCRFDPCDRFGSYEIDMRYVEVIGNIWEAK